MTDFSTRVRRATMVEHREAETRGFISRLMSGSVPLPGFAALTAQYLAVYRELEGAAERMRADDGLAAVFADPALTRVPALEADLAHLYGADWESAAPVLDSTRAYATRLRDLAATSPVHFIAHHYVRYLGDLSGGQMIGRKLSTVYGLGDAGTSFYRFEQIPDARAYKIDYRAKLDALDLPEEQAAALVAEAQLAFRFNGDVFVELGALFPETPEDLAPAA
ncbi:heme oxygenase (biliverdin-producing) [Actinoplanes couchii]|uniref:Heme oxygenase n=1 Tax=Actinoplanes couchii TaxID=403638 RepID=A0ABQ3XI89_9ACTN|nr:biliverdin-producing heme oxygenase [Actinoplanes couchii]MDR6324656.1 heme oxygenase [Actinoplanes couchii]GID58209.1 heme oxygenase [Actinoplanes couchii]